MKDLLFGTAGIPMSCNGDTLDGIRRVNQLGLNSMELEFVRNINVSADVAPKIKKIAKEEGIVLTCHGQYYVNLNALDVAKLRSSVQRILSAAKRAYECGVWSICFHMAYYMKQDKLKVHDKIVNEVKNISKKFNDEGIKLWLRPETTGKITQWGDLIETLKLSKEVENVLPCVDFSHLHARSGKYNTYGEFKWQLEQIEKYTSREGLDNIHIHLSGINYGEKGEKNHLVLDESDMNYKDLLRVLKEFKVKGVVVCESPNIEIDALLLQKTYKRI